MVVFALEDHPLGLRPATDGVFVRVDTAPHAAARHGWLGASSHGDSLIYYTILDLSRVLPMVHGPTIQNPAFLGRGKPKPNVHLLPQAIDCHWAQGEDYTANHWRRH